MDPQQLIEWLADTRPMTREFLVSAIPCNALKSDLLRPGLWTRWKQVEGGTEIELVLGEVVIDWTGMTVGEFRMVVHGLHLRIPEPKKKGGDGEQRQD